MSIENNSASDEVMENHADSNTVIQPETDAANKDTLNADDQSAVQAQIDEQPAEQRIVQDVPGKPRKKAVPLTDEQLEKGIEELPPYLHNAVKDRLDQLPRTLMEALVAGAPVSRRAMIRYDIPFNRHQKRELAVEAVYQHLLLDKDIRKCLYDVLLQSNKVDGYLYELSVGSVENEQETIEQLNSLVRKDWGWDRLSKLEQAILLTAVHEMKELDTPKNVVINEAVTLAKEYCDPTAPALINAVLDQIA